MPPPRPGEPVTYGQDTFNIFTNTGGSNEVWSYGEKVEAVLVDLLALRERLRPYLSMAFAQYARTGDPVMAPLFYRFPWHSALFDRGDAYMLGAEMLVAPILAPGAERRSVGLPEGETWVHAWTGAEQAGGSLPEVAAPWGRPPVFLRKSVAAALRPLFEA